jgi:hypothetical protein
MAELLTEIADHEQGLLSHHYEHYSAMGPDPVREKRVQALNSAASTFRIMGTFEDRSRKFVGELIAEHGR